MHINVTPPPISTLSQLKSRQQYVKSVDKVKLIAPKQYQSYLSSPSPSNHIKAELLKKETTLFVPPGFVMGVVVGTLLMLIL